MRMDKNQYKSPPQLDSAWNDIHCRYYWHTHAHYRAVEQYLWMHVLDIGCGPGFLAARCYPNIGWYTGVDISPVAIEQAKALFPGAHFSVWDAEHKLLPFLPNTFETVVCSETLEHMLDHSLVLRDMQRVTNTYMVITVPMDMEGLGHCYPRWEYDDLVSRFGPMGKILEIRGFFEENFWLVHIRKQA